MTVAAWVLQVALALFIGSAGLIKLAGDPAMVAMFSDIGAGQWLRFVVGILEVAGGIGLLIPRLRALAALGIALLLLGATLTNLTVLHTDTIPSVLAALVAVVVLLLRRHELPRVSR